MKKRTIFILMLLLLMSGCGNSENRALYSDTEITNEEVEKPDESQDKDVVENEDADNEDIEEITSEIEEVDYSSMTSEDVKEKLDAIDKFITSFSCIVEDYGADDTIEKFNVLIDEYNDIKEKYDNNVYENDDMPTVARMLDDILNGMEECKYDATSIMPIG